MGDDSDFIDDAVAGITDEHVEDMLCQTLASTDAAHFETLLAAGSLGTPEARELRARGKRMLYAHAASHRLRSSSCKRSPAGVIESTCLQGTVWATSCSGSLIDQGHLNATLRYCA